MTEAALLALPLTIAAQSTKVEPVRPSSASEAKPIPSQDSLNAIARRGLLLSEYDFVAWAASDSVTARRPTAGLVQEYLARQRAGKWNVAFGRLNAGRDTFFIAFEVRQRQSDRKNFDVRAFTPALADTGYYARAARAIVSAHEDFGKRQRPYNPAVLERDDGSLWVYLMPAQIQNGAYPLGADVRYLFDASGRTILAKRRLHNVLIEQPLEAASSGLVASTHSAVLDDVPEDTDVFHVLVRRPQVPEYIVTDAFVYCLSTAGEIRLLGRRREVLGESGEPRLKP